MAGLNAGRAWEEHQNTTIERLRDCNGRDFVADSLVKSFYSRIQADFTFLTRRDGTIAALTVEKYVRG